MNRGNCFCARCGRLARQTFWIALAGYFWLLDSPLVWAAKKKAEVVEAETKSYVMPYMIVLMLIGMGLMAILRPAGRLDRPDDKKKDVE